MDLQVIKIDQKTGRVSFGVTGKPVSGLSKLIQMVILSLFNSPGKDVLNPSWGAGLQDMIWMNFSDQDASEISAEITRRLRKAETEIQAAQIGLNISAAERLREIRLLGLLPGEDQTEILATIRVVSELGQQTDIMV